MKAVFFSIMFVFCTSAFATELQPGTGHFKSISKVECRVEMVRENDLTMAIGESTFTASGTMKVNDQVINFNDQVFKIAHHSEPSTQPGSLLWELCARMEVQRNTPDSYKEINFGFTGSGFSSPNYIETVSRGSGQRFEFKK